MGTEHIEAVFLDLCEIFGWVDAALEQDGVYGVLKLLLVRTGHPAVGIFCELTNSATYFDEPGKIWLASIKP